jgi:hypothetical protein
MMPTVPAMLLTDGLLSPPVISCGLSGEAGALREQSRQILLHMWESISVRETVDLALADLEKARRDASSANWDGEGARAINPAAYAAAKRFILTLPSTAPAPSVSVDPDGEVDLAWDFDRDQVFSISISGTRRLAYAGILGQDRHSGSAQFIDEIPASVSNLLSAYFARRR